MPPAGQPSPPSGQPQPPSGQPGGPGGGQWQGGIQAPWMPPEPPAAEDPPGVAHGVPLSRRGHIAIDFAGFTDDSGQDSVLALALDVHMPVARRVFADVRVPMMGALYPGNIMLGAGRVSKLDPRGFLAYSAQIGLPLVTRSVGFNTQAFSYPNGTWNIHEFTAGFLPIKLAVGYERMIGLFELRLDLEPILSIPVGSYGYNVGFTLQHAAEFQIGHTLGGGVRVQGVAVTPDILSDAYQFSVEPFLVARRELGFARLGLLLPIDDSVAGPAFEQAWGLRLMTGLNID